MSLLVALFYFAAVPFFVIFIAIYLWFRFQYTYWERKNVHYEKPKFPFGNFKGIGVTKVFDELLKNHYIFHKKEKAVGLYIIARKCLLVTDLEIAKNILIKDFDSFINRGFFRSAEKYDPLTGNLAFLEGNKWKHLRTKLTPAFTSWKMKKMFPIFLKCGDDFKDFLAKSAENDGIVEIKETTSNYTIDLIASCAFGLVIRSFRNSNSEFKNMGSFLFSPNLIQQFTFIFCFLMPKLANSLRIKVIPTKVTDFFMRVVKDTIEYREKNDVQRNDIMEVLIELKNKGKIENPDGTEDTLDYDPTFTITEAAAQAFGFFFGGFESSARTLMFCLYELALHRDIQDKLREEIDRVIAKHEGKITYDGIQEMTYLDQVVSETLRKYPAVPNVARICTKPYYIPEINLKVEKDTLVLISTLGLHHDPDYYPNPEKFDPDRFLPKNKERRESMSYLPFGEGPRSCIGIRFGLMQAKTGLLTVLSNFEFALSEKTKTPLVMNPNSLLLDVKGRIYLKIRKRC